MGILDKFRNQANGLKENKEDIVIPQASNSSKPTVVMMNDGVNICALACSACWDTPLPGTYEERAVYVGKRTKTGHTSVIEHSNIVFYLYVDGNHVEDLIEILDIKHFVNTVVKKSQNSDGYHMLVGGTWRGFADLYLYISSIFTNAIAVSLTNAIYQNVPSHAMRDITDLGLLDASMFEDIDTSEMSKQFNAIYHHRIDENINIVSADSIYKLADHLRACCSEPWLFTYKDLLRLVTITVEFNGMSRIITQQLTRHRNGITQESQRYVDYSGAPFNSPALFKAKYNPKKLYDIEFGGQHFKMNLQNLGNSMNKIYGQLRDKAKLGQDALIPEDARAYLTNNTQCGRIFMTFTYYNFIKFLQLREDAHAQAEIHSYAERLGSWFRQNIMDGAFSSETNGDKTQLYKALNPVMTDKSDFSTRISANVDDEESSNYVDGNEVGEFMTDEEYEQLAINSIEMEAQNDTEDKEENKE